MVKRMKMPKMPRQPVSAMTPLPARGAMAGTRVKTIITKEMSRAISRPA